MKNVTTIFGLLILLLITSCRKELDFSPVSHNLIIDFHKIDYNEIWHKNWKDELLFELNNFPEIAPHTTVPNSYNIALYKYKNNAPDYLYNIQGFIGNNQIITKNGTHQFILYSNDYIYNEYNILKRGIVCSTTIHLFGNRQWAMNPDIFYYNTIRGVEIEDSQNNMIYCNNEWQQQIKSCVSSPLITYIIQIRTKRERYTEHTINDMFISGLHNSFNLEEELICGDTTMLKSCNTYKISDSLFVSKFHIYKQDIENNNSTHTLYLSYSDILNYNLLLGTPIDSVLHSKPDGGIITLEIDLDSAIYKSMGNMSMGGVKVELEEQDFEKIDIIL